MWHLITEITLTINTTFSLFWVFTQPHSQRLKMYSNNKTTTAAAATASTTTTTPAANNLKKCQTNDFNKLRTHILLIVP
jgi:hypothetical protein